MKGSEKNSAFREIDMLLDWADLSVWSRHLGKAFLGLAFLGLGVRKMGLLTQKHVLGGHKDFFLGGHFGGRRVSSGNEKFLHSKDV